MFTLSILDPRIFQGGNNLTFVILARSLLGGNGYRDLSCPERPIFIGLPPAYPIFLAVPMALVGENIIVFRLASLALSCLSLFFFYKLLQIIFPSRDFYVLKVKK